MLKYSHKSQFLWSCSPHTVNSFIHSKRVLVDLWDINLELHVALYLPLCLLAVLSLDVPTAQWMREGDRPDFSSLITTAKWSVAESSRLACIINRCGEGFLALSKLNVNDTTAQGAPHWENSMPIDIHLMGEYDQTTSDSQIHLQCAHTDTW